MNSPNYTPIRQQPYVFTNSQWSQTQPQSPNFHHRSTRSRGGPGTTSKGGPFATTGNHLAPQSSSSEKVSSNSSGFSSKEQQHHLLNTFAFQEGPEEDDYLHDLGPGGRKSVDSSGSIFTWRGFINLGSLFILGLALVMLFAGYPILTYFLHNPESLKGGFNLGGSNASGQVPQLMGLRSLIDPDTPEEAHTRKSLDGSKDMKLVFSDEFNTDGRSFYPGDDPFWEAVNLHYWGTENYEWYDPAAVTTKDGNLVITLEEMANHNLNFRGGMVSTWNKMCFTGGYVC